LDVYDYSNAVGV